MNKQGQLIVALRMIGNKRERLPDKISEKQS